MMRSVEFFKSFRILAIVIVCASVSSYAALQIELNNGIIGGKKDSIAHFPGAWITGTLNGEFSLVGDLSLIVFDEMNGYFKLTQSDDNLLVPKLSTEIQASGGSRNLPFKEQRLNPVNEVYAGLHFKGLEAGYRNIQYVGSEVAGIDGYKPAYFAYDEVYDSLIGMGRHFYSYKQMIRQVVEGQYDLAHDRMIFAVSARYFINQNQIDSNNYVDSLGASVLAPIPAKQFDTYLYSTGKVGVHISEIATDVTVGGVITNHFIKNHTFDSYNFSLLANGDYQIADNRIDGRVRTDFLIQKYLDFDSIPTSTPGQLSENVAQGATGFFQTVYIRDSYTLDYGLTLKGLVVNTLSVNAKGIGRKLWKQRYELAVRKAWAEGSFIDAGSFTTMGGVFPMLGAYGRGGLQINDQYSVTGSAKWTWDWPRSYGNHPLENTYFDKFTSGVEVSYRMTKPVELLIGGVHTLYNQEFSSDFPSRYTAYCGVRVCLE